MYLRKLEMKDAPLMLEWMHDDMAVCFLQTDFRSKTIEDCRGFINASCGNNNMHLAVADDEDQYMGTVSLKNITGRSAEFAIAMRSCAMGKGYSKFAMENIIKTGFEELGLSLIYWSVSPDNKRAVRFYDKNGYNKVPSDTLVITGGYSREQILKYLWYRITREEWKNKARI